MFLKRLAFLLFVGITITYAAVDTVYMSIESSGIPTIPIGITEFEKVGADWKGLREEPHQTLERDMLLSGHLEAHIESKYSRLAFFKARATYYVEGHMERNANGSVRMECKLLATQSQQQVLGKVYTVPMAQVRQALHDFTNQIVWQLSGARGNATTKLAFTGKVNGQKQIFLSDYDGYNLQSLTQGDGINFMPAWGNDLDHLYFVSFRNGPSQIFERIISTGSTRVLFPSLGQTFSPDVNANGDLAFAMTKNGGSDIWVGSPRSGKVERLTYQRSAETSPSWNPNGQGLLYSADPSGNPQIFAMDKDGSNAHRITFLGKYNESARLSPEGDRIVYTSLEDGAFNIYTCDLDGTDVVQLTSGDGNNEHPVWSPDGMLIAFSSDRSGSSQIYLMRKDGSAVTRITSGGEFTWPSWSPLPPSTLSQGENQ